MVCPYGVPDAPLDCHGVISCAFRLSCCGLERTRRVQRPEAARRWCSLALRRCPAAALGRAALSAPPRRKTNTAPRRPVPPRRPGPLCLPCPARQEVETVARLLNAMFNYQDSAETIRQLYVGEWHQWQGSWAKGHALSRGGPGSKGGRDRVARLTEAQQGVRCVQRRPPPLVHSAGLLGCPTAPGRVQTLPALKAQAPCSCSPTTGPCPRLRPALAISNPPPASLLRRRVRPPEAGAAEPAAEDAGL